METEKKEVELTKKTTKVKKVRRKAITKAKRKERRLMKGKNLKRRHKIYTRPRFYRPVTLHHKRVPKFPKHIAQMKPKTDNFDKYGVIIQPYSSEKAIQVMEEENTLVFQVRLECTKKQIRHAFNIIYNPGAKQGEHQYQIRKINTLIT